MKRLDGTTMTRHLADGKLVIAAILCMTMVFPAVATRPAAALSPSQITNSLMQTLTGQQPSPPATVPTTSNAPSAATNTASTSTGSAPAAATTTTDGAASSKTATATTPTTTGATAQTAVSPTKYSGSEASRQDSLYAPTQLTAKQYHSFLTLGQASLVIGLALTIIAVGLQAGRYAKRGHQRRLQIAADQKAGV